MMSPSRSNFYDPGYCSFQRNEAWLTQKVKDDLAASYQSLIDSKSNRKMQGQARTKLFTAIGFCLSLIIVIILFEWKFYESRQLVQLSGAQVEFEEIMLIPITKQLPPPPPKLQMVHILEVSEVEEIKEDEDLNLDLEVTNESDIEKVVHEEFESIEEETADVIYQFVEQYPEPVGGMPAFLRFLKKNIRYPLQARVTNIEGKVYVSFVVLKDGSVTNVVIRKGIGYGCDEEAVRVVSQSPKWDPGKQRGRAVNVHMTVPIHFVLG